MCRHPDLVESLHMYIILLSTQLSHCYVVCQLFRSVQAVFKSRWHDVSPVGFECSQRSQTVSGKQLLDLKCTRPSFTDYCRSVHNTHAGLTREIHRFFASRNPALDMRRFSSAVVDCPYSLVSHACAICVCLSDSGVAETEYAFLIFSSYFSNEVMKIYSLHLETCHIVK